MYANDDIFCIDAQQHLLTLKDQEKDSILFYATGFLIQQHQSWESTINKEVRPSNASAEYADFLKLTSILKDSMNLMHEKNLNSVDDKKFIL